MIALGLVGLGSGCRSAPPPNVLLFTLDTTRADAIGAYDPGRISVTPTLDGLAADGVRFARAYTVTPLTIPAHSSLHTGLLPPRHQVRDNGDAFLSDQAVTLAERLHDGGYATMASVGAEVTSRHWGFAQGFDAYFDQMAPKADRWKVERRGEAVAADAERWLAQTDPKKPWFAWVHLYDAHFPYDPPAPYRDLAGGDPYCGEVAYVDHVVGEVIGSLPKDVADRTWIFALADHGEARGEHGEAMHGVLLYDPTTRIPLIVHPPGGLAPARVVNAPVSLVDLYPTILALAGLAPQPGVDGFDLSAVLRSRAEPDPTREVYVESRYGYEHYGWAVQRAWVDGDHEYLDSTHPTLYARSDGAQTDDRLAAEPEVARRMKGELEAYAATLEPQGTLSSSAPASQIAALAALGYLAPDPTPNAQSLDTAAPQGPLPDPVSQLPFLAWVEAARQALQTGHLDRARELLTGAIDAQPDLVDPRLLLAAVEEQSGNAVLARAMLQDLLGIRRSSRVLVQLGALDVRMGELSDGLALLDEARRVDPYVPQTWYAYLPALWAAGDPAAFLAAADDGLAHLPTDPTVRGYAAMAHPGPESVDPLRAAIAESPGPFLQLGSGLALRSAGRDEEAEDAFLGEVELWPPALSARRALVALYAEQRRYDEQLVQLDAISAAEEPSIDTFHSRAQALFNLGRYPEAQAAVGECRRFAPTYPGCAMLEANVLDKLGQHDAAVKAFDEAKRLQR